VGTSRGGVEGIIAKNTKVKKRKVRRELNWGKTCDSNGRLQWSQEPRNENLETVTKKKKPLREDTQRKRENGKRQFRGEAQ